MFNKQVREAKIVTFGTRETSTENLQSERQEL
jgi:hypothetical protein